MTNGKENTKTTSSENFQGFSTQDVENVKIDAKKIENVLSKRNGSSEEPASPCHNSYQSKPSSEAKTTSNNKPNPNPVTQVKSTSDPNPRCFEHS